MAVMTLPKPTGAAKPGFGQAASRASIELYWLPLGAGGWFVRLNGRIWEAIHALLEHRRPLAWRARRRPGGQPPDGPLAGGPL
jgi:hypothetical protein